MVVAGNTSPHAPPSLNLPTQSETPPKTLLGRLLLRGRPADEPENAEKVYPWYVVLWLSRGRLFLEPRIPTGHSSLGCWCPLSTGGCAGTGHASGSGPGLFTSGPTLMRGPGLDRSVRTSAPRLEGQDLHPHPFGFHRHGFRDYHDAVCSRCGSSRDCKPISPQLCWRGTHAPDLDVAVATGHCVHVRLSGGNRNGSDCSPSITFLLSFFGSWRAVGDSPPSRTPSSLGLEPECSRRLDSHLCRFRADFSTTRFGS